jgi:orotate phosphoribosyltransferase
MKVHDDVALDVAKYLLQIKAIKLQPAKPFTWASGWKSPIYCDNRITLSFPKIRTYIRQQLVKAVTDNFGTPDLIVGVATGGIALGVLIAQDLGLPFAYVRPEVKNHGMNNAIEGVVEKGQSIVVVEDLVSTGKSSLHAVEVLREAGCDVKGMAAIFSYSFQASKDNFKKAKCKLVTLTKYDTLIKQAAEMHYVTEGDLSSLRKWREMPEKWGQEEC